MGPNISLRQKKKKIRTVVEGKTAKGISTPSLLAILYLIKAVIT